ncbi:MAG: DUF1353 domain-containing protein [Nocardioidaceae bacterium]
MNGDRRPAEHEAHGVSLAQHPARRDSEFMSDLPWAKCFVDPDNPAEPATIRLRQVTRKTFVLESSMRYTGPTGVEGLPESALTLRPSDLGPDARTDLASVPAALRWFVSSYDVHTPAALLHDRLIGKTAISGVPDTDADRFFRFMLKELGVRFMRRWMMWTAVAFGSRWRAGGARRFLLLLWVLLAVGGISSAVYGAVRPDWTVLTVAVVAPLLASFLWGRQYGAGLTAAATAIWVLPPTLIGAIGFGVYYLLEQLIALLPLPSRVAGDEPIKYRNF